MPTFFLGASWACTHTPGTTLRRWPAWLKTSRCTGPRRSHTCGTVTRELAVEGSVCRLICADLLCAGIKLVEELLRDVGCIPRHGDHGADACNTRQLQTDGANNGCWGLCFHCKVYSMTYKILCRCKEVVFWFMEPTQTCEQHLIHLWRCLVLHTGCSPFPDVLKTCLSYAPPGPAPLPCSRKNTPPIAAILPFRR